MSALEAFPQAIAALKGTPWSADQRAEILSRFLKTTGWNDWAMADLGFVVGWVRSPGWDDDYALGVLLELFESSAHYGGFVAAWHLVMRVWSDLQGQTQHCPGGTTLFSMCVVPFGSPEEAIAKLPRPAEVVRKGNFSVLYWDNKKQADEILAFNGWDYEKLHELATFLHEQQHLDIDKMYDLLLKASEGMRETGWSPDQKFKLLFNLGAFVRPEQKGTIYDLLPDAIERLKEFGFTYDQQTKLLTKFAQFIRTRPGWGQEPLLSLIGFNKRGLTSQQAYDLLIDSSNITKDYEFCWLVADLFKATSWNYEQIAWVVASFFQAALLQGYGAANTVLHTVESAVEAGWGPERLVNFIVKIREALGPLLGKVSVGLPTTISVLARRGMNEDEFVSLMRRHRATAADFLAGYNSIIEIIEQSVESGWTVEDVGLLLDRTVGFGESRTDKPDYLGQIVSVMGGLQQRGWKATWQVSVLTRLAEMEEAKLSSANDDLLAVVDRLRGRNWSDEAIYQFLMSLPAPGRFVEGGTVEAPVSGYLAAYTEVALSGWTEGEKTEVLSRQLCCGGKKPFSDIGSFAGALRILNDTPWSPDQTFDLVGPLVKLPYLSHQGDLYAPFGMLVQKLQGSGLTEDAQLDLLDRFVKSNAKDWTDKYNIGFAAAQMKVAIESLSDVPANEIYRLLTDWIFKTEGRPELYQYLPQRVAVMCRLGWSYEQVERIVRDYGRGHMFENEFHPRFSKVIEGLKESGWTGDAKYQFFLTLRARAEKNLKEALTLAAGIFANASPDRLNDARNSLLSLLSSLTDYNRGRVLELLNSSEWVYNLDIGKAYFPDHLALYAAIFKRWPRFGFAVLEGVIEATRTHIIPRDLTEVREKILHFIGETNGFIPSLYKSYIKNPSTLEDLKRHIPAILNDTLGLADAKQIIQKNGEDFFLGLIQTVSPTSGASFVKKNEQLGLMKTMLEAGDLRDHVPVKWKGRAEKFAIEQGFWSLKEGLAADPNGQIKELLDQFRAAEGGKKVDEEDLIAALTKYLQETDPQKRGEARGEAQKTLYALAGQNDALHEKIDRIHGHDYGALLLLEQLFGDKDNLQKMLADAVDKVPPEALGGKGERKQIEGDAKRLVKSLKAVWSGETPEAKRIEALARILRVFKVADIQAKILGRGDLEESLKGAIQTVMREAPALSKKKIIGEILREPMELIRKEKVKYAYDDSASVTIGLRAVKGPAYGLHGLSSGACVATDVELWKNPNFKLLAITDEGKKQVVGYIHVFETVIDSKKYLTLPGINPSTEFMATVDAQRLYEGLIKQVVAFAQAGGYQGVAIPTSANIHSNRADIQKAIKKASYPIRQIPPVEWNTLPSPYPFDEVYVVWKR